MPKQTRTEQEAYDEALRRIEKCRREEGTALFLSGLGLTRVPAEVGKLSALTELYLTENQLTGVPAELSQLTVLKQLWLHKNRLTTLPAELGKLTALTRLSLYQNQVTAIPAELGELTALRQLDLKNNHLTAVPAELGKLTGLRLLSLNDNQLTALPAELGQLTALMELWLQSNQLASLPPQLRNLRNLQRLWLHDNPALNLSPAVLGADPRVDPIADFASPQAILDFYFSRQTQATRPLNEVKMILVGRGGAGKTSTVRALTAGTFDEDEGSTPGIALCDWKMDGCQGEPVTAHVWDFAGQVITHSLHQFFFSVRTVYVLVLTGRENSEQDDAEYWLRLIQAFGTETGGEGPPVLVALNKWDLPGCRPRVDRGALKERYPFIREFVEMDCQSKLGIPQLQAALYREVDALPWVRDPFPASWDDVRRALSGEDGGTKRPHIPYADYRRLCSGRGVEDEGHQDSLSEILHNLGAALNYRNDPRLREATVLQPEWLTNNVYKLMRHAEAQAGLLYEKDLPGVLPEEPDPQMRAYLVRLMERFEIAYPHKPQEADLWLVPQALPDSQPEETAALAAAPDATRLRYTYPALPEGLVARAIVRLHEFIEEAQGRKQQWASGAILAREGARALLRKEPKDRVLVTVTGPVEARQQLAGLCQAVMRDIHRDIRGLDPVEEMQAEGEWIKTRTLERDEKLGRQTGISTEERGTVMIDPEATNNAFTKKPARQEEVWKPSVFISYSKSNVNQRKRLELELTVLKNAGLLAGAWHDRMIDPGDSWNDAIQRELAEADVVIFLVSTAALATEYIMQHELPHALAGKAVVVPLILEECEWALTALQPLNALPEKGVPINKWSPRADGWNSAAKGLAKRFRKLIDGRRGNHE
jgi:signal recognition particle receptor subunit beta